MTIKSIPKYFLYFFSFLVAIGPFAMDVYLPAIPSMAENLNTSIVSVNNTISYFLIGYALGQFLGGPFSDQIGRKKIGGFGLLIFVITSLLIAFSDSIKLIQIIRIIQAIGAGFSTVICMASIRDAYGAEDAGKKYALVMVIMMIAPILAPTIGTLLLKINWRAIFVFLSIYAGLVLLFYYFKIPETVSSVEKKISIKPILKQYKEVITHRVDNTLIPIKYVIAIVMAGGVMMTFLTNSSYIYMEYFGVSENLFPALFGANVALLIICTSFSMRLMDKVNPKKVFKIGSLIQFFSILSLLVLAITKYITLWNCVPLIILSVGTLGLIYPTGSAVYISFFDKRAGSASALVTFSMFIIGSLLGFITSILFNNTLVPVFTVMLFSALISNIVGNTIPYLEKEVLKNENNIL